MNKEPSDHPAPDPDRWDDLARFLAGETTAAEAAEIRRWLEADPRRAELLTSLDTSLSRLVQGGAVDVDVEAALRRVKSRVDDARIFELRPRKRTATELFNRRWSRTLTRVAAIVIVVLGLSVVWRAAQRGPAGTTVTAPQVFTAAPGKTDSVHLSDQTRVILAPGSRLTVAAGYGSGAREVELNGEALFDVKHDAARPFSVRAGAATIRDIGTSFVVRSIAAQGVRVAVTSGSVVLHASAKAEREGVVLRAGDRGVLDQKGNVVAQRGGVTDEDIAFTSGRLVFDDATMDEVSAQLKRWYGIEMRVVDPELSGRHVTAAFDGEPAQQVLHVIGLALGANIERNGDTAFVRSSR